MAAEAVVNGVVGDVMSRAISLLAGQLTDRQSVGGKLQRLRHLVVKLESVVEAADARRISSRALLAWLSELVDGAHQGRYFLDAFQGEDEALEVADEDDGEGHGEGEPRRSLFLPSSFSPAKRLRVAARRLLFRRGGGGGAGDLDSILANLESVSGDLAEFISLLQICPPALHRPLATNVYADCQMFGRHIERRRVIEFLLQDGGGGELGVLAIVGRAGIGKTVLVQNVCNELPVRRRFSLIILLNFRCSLPVSGETAQLLRSLFAFPGTGSRSNLAAGGGPLRLIERRLRDERFLVVFDSVDPRRKQVIDAIMPALRRGLRGSRVIVTGTDEQHLAGLGTAEPVVLRPLPPAEYWCFFKAHAFAGAGDAEADPRLAAAGQAIAIRLRGSFVGAKIVGTLLRLRPDARAWRAVLIGSYNMKAAATSLPRPEVSYRLT